MREREKRAWQGLCTGLIWLLRLAYLACLALFAGSLFPPHTRWAGMLAAGLGLTALAQGLLAWGRWALGRETGGPPAPARSGGGVRLEGRLEWRDVTYGPPGSPRPALRQVNFRLTAGTAVVLGETGGLFGALSTGRAAADEGNIYYGNDRLETIAPEELAGRVALLTAGEDPPEGAIGSLLGPEGRAVGRELGLHPLVRAAGGYEAPLARLSDGGQTLARIAAALADKPGLLILDHLLERLDEAAADRVLAAAERRGTDCAAVTVRECLPRRVGRVLEFQGDTLVFQGTRDEFLAWEEAGHGRDTP